MFGLSFSEVLVIALVALVAVGPKKLPGMLRTLGEWARKLRVLTHEMRTQSGIDEILRAEGVHGGLNELRGLMRGQNAMPYIAPVPEPVATQEASLGTTPSAFEPPRDDGYTSPEIDPSKEYPLEGADSYGVLPDDLFDAAPVEHTAAAFEGPVTSSSVQGAQSAGGMSSEAEAALPDLAPSGSEATPEQHAASAPAEAFADSASAKSASV